MSKIKKAFVGLIPLLALVGCGNETVQSVTFNSLSCQGNLVKRDYYVDENFDPYGLTIKAGYSNGTSKVVTDFVNWDKLTLGATSVTGSFTDLNTTLYVTVFDITVSNRPVTFDDLVVTGTPSVTDYYVGESFNSAGLTVTAYYSDTTSKNVTELVTWETLVLGMTKVKGYYTENNVTRNVTVSGIKVEAVPASLESLSKTGTLVKTVYDSDESFDPTGLTITAHYSDTTSKEVTNDVVWEALKVGDTSVKGSYTESQKTVYIEVTGITVNKPIENEIKLLAPSDNSQVDLLHDDLRDMLNNLTTTYFDDKYPGKNNYYPKNLTLNWEEIKGATNYKVYLANNFELENAKTFDVDTTSLTLKDLDVGERYYWKVTCTVNEIDYMSKTYIFNTAKGIKMFEFEKAYNVRDFGGHQIDGGSTVQGIAFRGGSLDGVNDADISKFKNELNVNTDLDLRRDEEIDSRFLMSPLGKGINWVKVGKNGAAQYLDGEYSILNPNMKDALYNELSTFANKDNYPIYFHCAAGRDRTGTLAIILNGILGVSEEEAFQDYMVSMFCKEISSIYTPDLLPSYHAGVAKTVINTLKTYNGNNDYQQGAIDFALNIGLSDTQIKNIQDIFSGKIKIDYHRPDVTNTLQINGTRTKVNLGSNSSDSSIGVNTLTSVDWNPSINKDVEFITPLDVSDEKHTVEMVCSLDRGLTAAGIMIAFHGLDDGGNPIYNGTVSGTVITNTYDLKKQIPTDGTLTKLVFNLRDLGFAKLTGYSLAGCGWDVNFNVFSVDITNYVPAAITLNVGGNNEPVLGSSVEQTATGIKFKASNAWWPTISPNLKFLNEPSVPSGATRIVLTMKINGNYNMSEKQFYMAIIGNNENGDTVHTGTRSGTSIINPGLTNLIGILDFKATDCVDVEIDISTIGLVTLTGLSFAGLGYSPDIYINSIQFK